MNEIIYVNIVNLDKLRIFEEKNVFYGGHFEITTI